MVRLAVASPPEQQQLKYVNIGEINNGSGLSSPSECSDSPSNAASESAVAVMAAPSIDGPAVPSSPPLIQTTPTPPHGTTIITPCAVHQQPPPSHHLAVAMHPAAAAAHVAGGPISHHHHHIHSHLHHQQQQQPPPPTPQQQHAHENGHNANSPVGVNGGPPPQQPNQPAPLPAGSIYIPYQGDFYESGYYFSPHPDMCPAHPGMGPFQSEYGPAAVQMVSQNRPPPLSVPVQVPQGQVMQPYLHETLVLYQQLQGGGVPHTHAQFIATNGTTPHPYYSPLAAGYPPGPGGSPHFHPMGGGGHLQPHQPVSHSPSPPSNYHKDDRTQRQHTKLMRKIDPKRDMNSAMSTPAHSPSPRKNELNGLRRTSRNGASSVGTSEDGEESSSVPDDEDDCQAIIDQLSGVQRPDVRDITSRSAMLRWEAPPISEIINIRDLTYVVLLSDRSKEGKYKIIFKGESYVCLIQDLRPAQEYLVRLQVHYEKLQGSASEATVFTTPSCEPDQPMPPRLMNCTKNSLQLRWAAPNCNGSPIIQYILEYDEGKGTTFVEAVKTKARQYIISKLLPTTLYSFRLSAVNEYGPSMYSDIITFGTVGNPPSTPRPPILQSTTPNSLRLSWERLSNDEEFTLQMSDRDSGRGFFNMYNGVDTIYECRGLRRASAYQFRLRADNEVGASSWSNEVTYKTQPERPGRPGKPQIRGPIQADYFRAKWDPPNDRGGADIRKYHLEINSGAKFERIYTGAEPEAICDRLSPGTNYQLRVACEGPGGQSGYSEMSTVTTDAVVPGTPEPPFCDTAPGAYQAELRWKRPVYNGGAPIIEYQLQLNGSQLYYGHETFCLAEHLYPGKEYEANVRAVNRVGAGPWSKPLKFTSAIAPPNCPDAPTIDVRSSTHLTVSWKEPLTNGAPLIEYRLESSSTNESSESFNTIYRGIQNSTDISNLVPYTFYYFRVNASNRAGYSQYSSVVSSQTPAAVPAAPQLLKSEYTSTEVTLTWSEPSSNGSEILYYNIDFDDQSITTDDNCTEYKITNLASETSYKFKIQAVSEVGAGQFSKILKLTTLPPPPRPPLLEVCGAGPNFIKLKWGDGKALDTNKFKLEKYKNRSKKFISVFNGRCHMFIDKKLREQTSYVYRISAYNERAGMGEYSEEYVFTTSATLPSEVKSLRAMAYATSANVVSGSQNLTTGVIGHGNTTGVVVTVEWEASKNSYADPIEYILECSPADGSNYYNEIYRGPDTKFTIEILEPGSVYQFRVRPVRITATIGDVLGNFSEPLTHAIVPHRLLVNPVNQKQHHPTQNHQATVSASTNQRSTLSSGLGLGIPFSNLTAGSSAGSIAGLCAIDSASSSFTRDDRIIKSNLLCNNANVGAIKRFTGKLTAIYSNRKRFTDKEKAVLWMFSFILLTICFAALVRMFMS